MFGLPKCTELNKQLPKKAIYAKFQMNNAAKEKLDADISRITIVNEVSSVKINIAEGETVKLFYVILVSLKKKNFDEKNLVTLSKLIPQNMLMVLEFEGQVKLAVYYTKLMQTDWKPKAEQSIELKGLNLDAVWENIIKNVEGGQWNDGLTLAENIQRKEQIAKIKHEIEKLEKQARAEKQPNKKFEIVMKIRELSKGLSYESEV